MTEYSPQRSVVLEYEREKKKKKEEEEVEEEKTTEKKNKIHHVLTRQTDNLGTEITVLITA